MTGARDTASRLFAVGVALPAGAKASDIQTVLGGDGRALCIAFPDGIRLVAAGSSFAAVKALIGETSPGIVFDSPVLEGEGAVRDIFERATPEMLTLFERSAALAEETVPLAPELRALIDGAARIVTGSESAWAIPTIDVAAMVETLSENIHGAVDGLQALAVGGGGFSQNVIRHLLAAGLKHFTVTARRHADAERFAISHGGHFAEPEMMESLLQEADIVITDIGDGRVWVSADDVNQALRRRRHKPILLVDGGIPGDIAPAVDRIEDAYLFSLDDLERMAMESLAGGDGQDSRNALIDAEVRRFFEIIGANDIDQAAAAMAGRSESWLYGRLAVLADENGKLPPALSEAIRLIFGAAFAQDEKRGDRKREKNERL